MDTFWNGVIATLTVELFLGLLLWGLNAIYEAGRRHERFNPDR